jgi:hypothetical protein
MLLAGVLIASWPISFLAKLELGMPQFGGLPWGRDFLSLNAGIFAALAGTCLVGLSLIGVSAVLFVRGRRERNEIHE